jgi:cytochrome c oxidase cbb3-type subunit III
MASVAGGFWAGWVAVITIVSAISLAWLVVSVYYSRDDSAEVAHQVWDETLREGTTAAPLWWFWMILALLATSVVYLILYPGFGSYAGVLRWSQGGQIASSLARHEERFAPERAEIAASALQDLQQDEPAMRSAWHLFNNHCTACHGPDARGQASLFPDLRDASWQWGRDEQQLAQTITQGRQGVMPGWQAVLSDEGIAKMADYVIALGSGTPPTDTEDATAYRNYCSACHGADGAGNPLLGAPALNDSLWLYGGSIAAVRESIASGRTGVMPAFGERLDDAQIKLLTAWLASGAAPLRGE